MDIFGQQYQEKTEVVQDFSRHSVHSVHFYQEQWQQHQMSFFLHQRPGAVSAGGVAAGGHIPALCDRGSDVMSVISGSSSEDSQIVSLAPDPGPPVIMTTGPPSVPPKQVHCYSCLSAVIPAI